MQRKITKQEIKKIIQEIEALPDEYGDGTRKKSFITIALPDSFDEETLVYAHSIIGRLRKEGYYAQISTILQFFYQGKPDKNYQVMKHQPFAMPFIRVYPQVNQEERSWYSSFQKRVFKLLRIGNTEKDEMYLLM